MVYYFPCLQLFWPLNSRHLLVALALFDSLFLLFAVLELSIPVSIPSHRHSLVSAHTRLVLHFRMLASGFYKASILFVLLSLFLSLNSSPPLPLFPVLLLHLMSSAICASAVPSGLIGVESCNAEPVVAEVVREV